MGKVKTFRIRIQGIEHIVEVEELNGSMHSSPAVPSSPVHTVAEPVPPPPPRQLQRLRLRRTDRP